MSKLTKSDFDKVLIKGDGLPNVLKALVDYCQLESQDMEKLGDIALSHSWSKYASALESIIPAIERSSYEGIAQLRQEINQLLEE